MTMSRAPGLNHGHHPMHGWMPSPSLRRRSSSFSRMPPSPTTLDHRVHHVPTMSQSSSCDSTSSATCSRQRRLNSPKHDYSSSKTVTMSRTPTSSFDSPREIAASVLLLGRDSTPSSKREISASSEQDESSSNPQKTRPLKKRKTKISTFPCHVSPMSLPTDTPDTSRSYEEDPDDNGNSNREATRRSSGSSSKSRSPSPSRAILPHFPSVLHMLLSSTTASTGQVVQWLPHGKAWKIVRWEALRRTVLPQFFPQFSGSIDAFLRHLVAWGFEEVTNGPDIGAYSHAVSSKCLENCAVHYGIASHALHAHARFCYRCFLVTAQSVVARCNNLGLKNVMIRRP